MRPGYRDGARAALPFAVAFAVFMGSWGVLAGNAGFGIAPALLLTATAFAGSAQYAAVSTLAAGGGVGAAVVTGILLNSRYGPIGVSVAPVLRGSVLKRLFLSQVVVDESWALSNRGGGRFEPRVLIGAGVTLYVVAVIATVAGVLAGDTIDPASFGIDAAFPALFLALLAPQVRARRPLAVAAAGAGIAALLVPFARPGIPVIVAAAACLWGWRRR